MLAKTWDRISFAWSLVRFPLFFIIHFRLICTSPRSEHMYEGVNQIDCASDGVFRYLVSHWKIPQSETFNMFDKLSRAYVISIKIFSDICMIINQRKRRGNSEFLGESQRNLKPLSYAFVFHVAKRGDEVDLLFNHDIKLTTSQPILRLK